MKNFLECGLLMMSFFLGGIAHWCFGWFFQNLGTFFFLNFPKFFWPRTFRLRSLWSIKWVDYERVGDLLWGRLDIRKITRRKNVTVVHYLRLVKISGGSGTALYWLIIWMIILSKLLDCCFLCMISWCLLGPTMADSFWNDKSCWLVETHVVVFKDVLANVGAYRVAIDLRVVRVWGRVTYDDLLVHMFFYFVLQLSQLLQVLNL